MNTQTVETGLSDIHKLTLSEKCPIHENTDLKKLRIWILYTQCNADCF